MVIIAQIANLVNANLMTTSTIMDPYRCRTFKTILGLAT